MNTETPMNTVHTAKRPHSAHPQWGLSLIELLVAITISLLLLAGVLQIFIGSRQTYTLQDGMARLQENARYVLDRIGQDITRTGYLGCSDSNDVTITNNLNDQGLAYDFATAIFAQDNAGFNNTDILTLRYGSSGGIRITTNVNNTTPGEDVLMLDTTNPNYDRLEQFDIITLSNCETVTVFMVTNNPTSSAGRIDGDTGIVAAFGPNAGQSNNAKDIGGVFTTENGSLATAFKTTSTTYLVGPSFSGNGNALFANTIDPNNELIQGVEDFQVLFGVNDDATLGADRYVTANNVTNGGTDWNDVVSVRINLRLNTVDAALPAGGTIAKDFTTTVRLRNRGDVI